MPGVSHWSTPIEEAYRAAAPDGAPLAEYLEALAAAARKRFPGYTQMVDGFVARLERIRAGEAAPSAGDPMPGFMLPDQDGRLVELDQLLGSGPVIVAILRGHWCPYCRLNMIALAEVARRSPDASFIVISPEMREFTRLLREGAAANLPVLTDRGAGYILSLGLAIALDRAIAELIEKAGLDVSLYQGGTGWILPIPAVFVLRRDGTVAARRIDPDYRRRMDVAELIEAVANAR